MLDNSYSIITWDNFKLNIKNNFDIDYIKIDDLFVAGTNWVSLEDWEDADDLELLDCLSRLKPMEGELTIVTEASYKKNLGPFCVKASGIREFVLAHYKNFEDRFFETDVIIANNEKKEIWIFHHEGVYAFMDFNSI